MSYANDTGYVPVTFAAMMNSIREAINLQFSTDYTEGTFIGTNWYKYFYVLVQKVLENEVKTAEIFIKLQEYIQTTNLRIQRPSTSLPGIIDTFIANGYVSSVKKNAVEDAGTVSVCVQTDDAADDYAVKRLQICNLLKDFVAAGMVFEGTETETIVLSNGQSFDFSFYLPTEIPVLLKLTITTTINQELAIPDDEAIRAQLEANVAARYRLGWDFEPQRYFTQVDAPWAATIKLEWSSDGGDNYFATVYSADFKDIYTFDLSNITVLVDP